MKVSYELKQGYIDIWNEESEKWDRYIKVNTKSVVEEPKGIPEKMMMCTSGIMSYEAVEHITTELKDKINEILDYLESKGE